MSNTKLLPAMTGTRTLGGMSIGSWLTCELPSSGTYQSSVPAPKHLQITGTPGTDGVVSAPAGFAARGNEIAVVGADAARKRGRPPRGEPC